MSNYTSQTSIVQTKPGIIEDRSLVTSERERFSSFNMSTVDGDDFVNLDDNPMGIESKRTRSINKYGEITPQNEASRLRAKQRRPSKLSSQVATCAEGCETDCSIF